MLQMPPLRYYKGRKSPGGIGLRKWNNEIFEKGFVFKKMLSLDEFRFLIDSSITYKKLAPLKWEKFHWYQ